MAESSHKDKLTCKGCNFVIRGDKLLVHLNHPKIKCKEAYSKDEYSLVYDLWMQTKLEIKIQDQDKIKCRGCQFDLDKFNLLWHLNDKKVDCKKAYSKDEYQLIFELWLYHKENPSKLPFEDFPCNELMECNGCKQMIISGEMYNHVRYHSTECAEKYYKLWDGLTNLSRRYSKFLAAVEREKIEKHYFKNVLELEPLNLRDMKPFFLEYGAIDDFVRTAYKTREDSQRWYGTIGVLLGVEDDYGFHGKELIYLPSQDYAEYWRHFHVKSFKAITYSKTYKDYPKTARILVWMTTGEYFNGYDAHTQGTNLKPLSNCSCTITLKAKVESSKFYEVGDYGLFELNELGIQSVQKCTFKQKKKEETFLCCQQHYKNFDKSLYHHRPVTLTYSTVIDVIDRRKHYRLSERKTIPALFDPKYFAKIDNVLESETLNRSEMKPNDVGISDNDKQDKPFIKTSKTAEDKSDYNDTKHDIPIEICRKCNKQLKINTIMKHLSSKSTCIKSYSDQDLKVIQRKIINFRNENRRTKHLQQKESSEEVVFCKVCHSPFHINTIKRHLAHFPSCKKQYPKDELQTLKLKCENYQKAKRCARDNARNRTAQKSSQLVDDNDGVSH